MRQRGGIKTGRVWLVKLARHKACQETSPVEVQDWGVELRGQRRTSAEGPPL